MTGEGGTIDSSTEGSGRRESGHSESRDKLEELHVDQVSKGPRKEG